VAWEIFIANRRHIDQIELGIDRNIDVVYLPRALEHSQESPR
jgi:hypothetical protein